MAWCRALGTSCLPGQSRSGTPRGELPPPYPSPASGGGSGWGQPRARKARVKLRVSRRSASPFVCGLGGHREKPRKGARGEGVRKNGGMKNSRANKNRAVRPGALCLSAPAIAGEGGPREAWWRGRLTRRFVVVERIFDEARAPSTIRSLRARMVPLPRYRGAGRSWRNAKRGGGGVNSSLRCRRKNFRRGPRPFHHPIASRSDGPPSPLSRGRTEGRGTQNGRESGRNAAAIGVQTAAACFRLVAKRAGGHGGWSAMISGRSSLRAERSNPGWLAMPVRPVWIASSLSLLAMTAIAANRPNLVPF